MLDSLEVKVFCPTWWRWRTSEAQGRDSPRGGAWKKRGANLRVDEQEPDEAWALDESAYCDEVHIHQERGA